jgi:hypothetical protein
MEVPMATEVQKVTAELDLTDAPIPNQPFTNTVPPITVDDLRWYYSRFSDQTAAPDDWKKLMGGVIEHIEYRGPNDLTVSLTPEAERPLRDGDHADGCRSGR